VGTILTCQGSFRTSQADEQKLMPVLAWFLVFLF
jgi:hypothetical protein